MNLISKIKVGLISCAAIISLSACSQSVNSLSSDEIYSNVFNEKDEPISYFGESVVSFDDMSDMMTIKEWRTSDGKIRTEVYENNELGAYSINDGTTMWSYDVVGHEVIYMDMTEELTANATMAVSEQAKILLDLVKDTHNLEIVGEDKVANRSTIHVKAEKKENTEEVIFIDKMEVWIDKETWFPLKITFNNETGGSVQEYTTFEVNPTFDESLFVFEMPEGAKLIDINSMSNEYTLETLEEGKEVLQNSFYYFENGDFELTEISVFESTTDSFQPQLQLVYTKDTIPYATIIVMNVEEENKAFTNTGVNIRGLEGVVDEFGSFRAITWVEDGTGYSVLIENEDLSTEEWIEAINQMKKVD